MTREDVYYLPPDPGDPDPCPALVGADHDPDTCGAHTGGEILCPAHTETLPDDEQVWYAAHAA